ncbi:PDZ domain-containing protein [Bythopirellula goksoeyrii]|uniref:Zinc metallopeptidase RseP n=1 Tax=Bythopirellula goksoeyrii TaxID=1400387 RepID=A0A5B9QU84_9BACT|nr:PDZ domain-containing protein [Bythopirellula goksoeyrii]QEG37631.1 zinc metallopeptidase RseP [Bythopirellula goksoeyrii]
MKRTHWVWEAIFILGATAVAALILQTLQSSQSHAEELEGNIVQIGPAGAEETDLPAATEEAAPVMYWIGLRGRNVDDPVLRTQLQLAEDMGVVVEDVVADSPAEKADLRKHDIILRANGDIVDSMLVLQDHVSKSQDKPIDLQILRLGKETSVTVTPEVRPDNIEQLSGDDMTVPLGSPDQALQRLLQQFGAGGGFPGGIGGRRIFGPGMAFNNNRIDLNAMPNGMSISIMRDNDGPAQITVKKGDQTWTLNSDDAKALAELPEGVRKYVEGMLQGQGGGFDIQKELGNLDWQAELKHMLPDNLGNLPGIQEHEDEVIQRMQKMEEQLKQLQQKLDEESN